MIRLAPRSIAIYCAIQVVAILSTLMDYSLLFYSLIMVGFLVVLFSDYKSVKGLILNGSISADLKIPHSLALVEKYKISVDIFSKNNIKIEDWNLTDPSYLQLLSGGENSFEKIVKPLRLGYFKILQIELSGKSNLGYWTFEHLVPLKIPIKTRIHPPLVKLKPEDFVELFQAIRLPHLGARKKARAIQGELFHSFREYQYPDPTSLIDAKKSAQLNQVIVRQMEALHSHHLVICLDLGRNLSGQIRGSSKLDYYLSAALKLAEVALSNRDQVSLILFSDHLHYLIRKTRNPNDLESIFAGADITLTRNVESSLVSLPRWINQVTGTRSLVVLLTDLERPNVHQSLLETLPTVCHQHLTAVVGLSDPANRPDSHLMSLANSKPKDNLKPELARYFYSLHVQEQFLEFNKKFSRLPGISLVVDDVRWMSSISELYSRLRNSAH